MADDARSRRWHRDLPIYVILSDVAGRAVALIVVLLAARLVATEREFAAFVLVISAVVLLLPVLQLGTPLVVVRLAGSALLEGDRVGAVAVCRGAIRIATVVAASTFLVACTPWAAGGVSAVLPIQVSRVAAVLIGLWLASEVLRGTVADALRALHRYKAYAMGGEAVRWAAVVALLVTLGFTNTRVGLSTLATVVVAANLACTLSMGAILRAEFRHNPAVESSEWPIIGTLLRPGSRLLTAVMAAWFLNLGDLWIVAATGNPRDVANYAVALRLAALGAVPLALTQNAIAPVLVSLRGDKPSEERLLQGTSAASGLIALAAYVLTLVAAAAGANAVLGSGYSMVVPLFAVLGASLVVYSATGHCGYALALHGREGLLGRVTVIFSAVALLAELLLGRTLGVMGVAAASGAATAGLNVVLFVLCGRRLRISLRPVVRYIRPALRVMSLGVEKEPAPTSGVATKPPSTLGSGDVEP